MNELTTEETQEAELIIQAKRSLYIIEAILMF